MVLPALAVLISVNASFAVMFVSAPVDLSAPFELELAVLAAGLVVAFLSYPYTAIFLTAKFVGSPYFAYFSICLAVRLAGLYALILSTSNFVPSKYGKYPV